MIKIAKFNIGDCVRHKQQGYRAVIADIDAFFQASGRYNPQSPKREFSSRHPWYRLLVDNSSQIAYVEECNLIADSVNDSINHPQLAHYLSEQRGHYHRLIKEH